MHIYINGRELKQLLDEYRVTAREALQLLKEGTRIGHTVHVFIGEYEG